MVRLKKLILKNFKSFKKAEIPITEGFSVVAGSNGSGKTNILDSLMFVLGASSLKSLRASKLTDLVNNDSTENYAKVELLLNNDGEDFEISRMVDKQGKSVFRMNSEKKTMNEVRSFLYELGIRADGHNIVVQGDIIRMVQHLVLQKILIREGAFTVLRVTESGHIVDILVLMMLFLKIS